jgi:hypothetical protein
MLLWIALSAAGLAAAARMLVRVWAVPTVDLVADTRLPLRPIRASG